MKYFGTDGIRAKAGEGVMRPEMTALMGRALGAVLLDRGVRSCLVGMDTRISGPMIESALVAGLSGEGLCVRRAGVIATPGAHAAARAMGLDAAIVVSASHNPAEDNGIKVLMPDGLKMPEDMERTVEELYDSGPEAFGCRSGSGIGRVEAAPEAVEEYIQSVVARHAGGPGLRGVKVVLDCANGAAHRSAPEAFERLGAEVVRLGSAPDGLNINLDCGALHPRRMAEAVVESGSFMGAALDGDGDRVIAADEKGGIVDGDLMLAVLARRADKAGLLPGRTVVATVMSNAGLEAGLASEGIRLHRTDVGDRNVALAMKANGWALGGEQSGHIIFSENGAPVPGDGTCSALAFLGAVLESGQTASAAAGRIKLLPQALLNVRVREKTPFDLIPGLGQARERVEKELRGRGRVLLRYSGTEDIARILVEGDDAAAVSEHAARLAQALKGGA